MEGSLIFGFDDDERLIKFENKANLNQLQRDALYDPALFPIHFSKLAALRGKSGKIEEVVDITFERFWSDYGYKVGKTRAQAEWNKLKRDEQALAISRIKRYKYFCDTNDHQLLYPERYLKYRRFDDER